MKAYVCDGCGITISDPYRATMKEFYVDSVYEYGAVFPENRKRKMKIHLCEDCYAGLYHISEEVRSKNK